MISEIWWPSTSWAYALLATTFFLIASELWEDLRKPIPLCQIIPSPCKSLLPQITPVQASLLPYPPNLLPGARDVDTPYGSMRVYEWGPKDGRKVILIHGNTTPAPLLWPIAQALERKNCRVMIFGVQITCSSSSLTALPNYMLTVASSFRSFWERIF